MIDFNLNNPVPINQEEMKLDNKIQKRIDRLSFRTSKLIYDTNSLGVFTYLHSCAKLIICLFRR